MDALNKAITFAGGVGKLAGLLNVTQQAVSNWKMPDRRIPLEHCIRIEQITSGAVKAADLRPDVYRPAKKGRAA